MFGRIILLTLLLCAIGVVGLIVAPHNLPKEHVLHKKGLEFTEKLKEYGDQLKGKADKTLEKAKDDIVKETKKKIGDEVDKKLKEIEGDEGNEESAFPIERTITDSKGRKLDVVVSATSEEEIVFTKKGSTEEFNYPMTNLSKEDQKFFMSVTSKAAESDKEEEENSPFN